MWEEAHLQESVYAKTYVVQQDSRHMQAQRPYRARAAHGSVSN